LKRLATEFICALSTELNNINLLVEEPAPWRCSIPY
jgi:hypothetical protein